jgi:hypothetical protein
MGLGSTMTGRQSTFCSPHISRCKADIGYVQSTKHTTASTQQALSAAKRRSATPHGTEMGHPPTMNTSRQRATHAIFGGHTERRSGQRARARAAQGGKEKEKEKDRMTAQTTTGMKSGWQHGTAHPFCCAADDSLESTSPSVTCKKREGPNTQ